MDSSTTLVAALLGLVEGLTEFIPVSSTGHLLLVGHFLGFDSAGNTFEVVIRTKMNDDLACFLLLQSNVDLRGKRFAQLILQRNNMGRRFRFRSGFRGSFCGWRSPRLQDSSNSFFGLANGESLFFNLPGQLHLSFR